MRAHGTIHTYERRNVRPLAVLRSLSACSGLSISASIVEAHGGRLDFDSVIGEGTSFYFDLKKIAV